VLFINYRCHICSFNCGWVGDDSVSWVSYHTTTHTASYLHYNSLRTYIRIKLGKEKKIYLPYICFPWYGKSQTELIIMGIFMLYIFRAQRWLKYIQLRFAHIIFYFFYKSGPLYLKINGVIYSTKYVSFDLTSVPA
jgi:hypothetical protein